MHIYIPKNNEILLSHIKILPLMKIWMDPEFIMLSEINQTNTVSSHLDVKLKIK